MTKDDPVEELTSDGTQQPQKPFQVILIDIEKASRHHIHCVEKPLEGDTEELSFVALSYRWGEVQESIIDTQLGYIATITSFALNDFYRLCHMMKKEPDLQHIKYVWVDAICVDQTNYERRKATIHKMSNIYEKATFILAVPDLHSEHLQNVYTEHRNFIQFHFDFDEYIYHLIQGNTAQLHHLDSTFLDDDYVPKDRTLRQLLATCTTFLANGFTDLEDHNYYRDEPGEALDLLCEIYHASLPTPDETLDLIKLETQKQDVHDDDDDPESLLHYDKVASLCLLDPYTRWEKIGKCDRRWIHKVMRRSNAIRQLVKFLGDLIVDWSSRVWVISEYNIAKKKNNLKYWFMLLSTAKTSELPFFKFDFTNPAFSSVIQTFRFNFPLYDVDVNPVHLSFHRLIIKQLNTQSFFEMMLKSKASKNEDRFYAILPLSKYKDKLNQVAHWEINHMMSVKLKLFEIMDTKDKWILLFLSGRTLGSNTFQVLPTFCSSTINGTPLGIISKRIQGIFTSKTNLPPSPSIVPITLRFHTTISG
ncbi:unnamed protein product [Absidia cylindrospora]